MTNFIIHRDTVLVFYLFVMVVVIGGVVRWGRLGFFKYRYQDLFQVILKMISSSCNS